MKSAVAVIVSLFFFLTSSSNARVNPVVPGWYADPDVVIFGDRYWIYPTYSAAYDQQTFLDAFSSPDLVTWTKHGRIVDTNSIAWATRAMWAPCAIQNDSKFYLFFSANDVHPGEVGGIGVAIADRPDGPYRDLLGKPLISENVNGAQPIDQAVFRDPKDGQWYIVYGGWQHCNIARLADDFTKLIPFDDGKLFREITPAGYVEGPMMFFRGGKVYFMWSEGAWTNATYRVAYAIGDSIAGPFKRIGVVIEPNDAIASGAGHHSILKLPNREEYYVCYHRRPAGETDANHREICIDRLEFNTDGTIQSMRMTKDGPASRPLR